MTERSGRVIELREYQKVALPREAFPEELGEAIWRRWAGKIEVDFPTPKTDHQWQLQSLGWVGHIPMDGGLTLYLSPKVPLENLFRLLEYAYSLDLHFPGGLTGCDALTEFYERLANILARRVLDRGLRGLYRSYLERREPLPYLRGRLDLRHQVEIMERVSELNRQGLTVIMVSHDINLASCFCTRLAALKQGTVAASGKPEEIVTPDFLETLYGCRLKVGRQEGTPLVILKPESGRWKGGGP